MCHVYPGPWENQLETLLTTCVTHYTLTHVTSLDMPHKLLVGGALLPDTAAWPGERREERLWKCVTRRRGMLDSEARARLRGVIEQVCHVIRIWACVYIST